MAAGDLHLSVYIGERWTAAAITVSGRTWPVTFDGHTRLASGVYLASPSDPPLTGVAGQNAGIEQPGNYLPDPLTALRVTASGDEASRAAAATSALLAHVANAASLQAGMVVTTLAVTTPEPWGPNSRQRLSLAATGAGLPEPAIVTASAAAAAAAASHTEGESRFVLVCTIADDFPRICILDTAGHYPQLAAVTVRNPDAPGIAAALADVVRHRATDHTTVPAQLDWAGVAEIARVRAALTTLPRTPALLPDQSAAVVVERADLAKAAQPHLDRIGSAAAQAALDADINLTDITATVLIAGDAVAPYARDAVLNAGLPAPVVLDEPGQLAVGAAELTAQASEGSTATAATVRLPRSRLNLSNLTTTAVLAVASTALLTQTVATADVEELAGRIYWILLSVENLALAAALAATAAIAAAQIAPTTWLTPKGMADPASTGYLLRRSYLAAAATGLVLAGLWGLGTGVALKFVDPRYLHWSLTAAIPIVLCALVIAAIAPRIPADRLITWLPSMRPPLWPLATAALGAYVIRAAYTTAVVTEDKPKVYLAAAVGAALVGAGTAATISANLWIRVTAAIFLVPGYALIITPRTDIYLVTAYTAALIWWHLNATARTIRAVTPDNFRLIHRPADTATGAQR